MKASIVRVEVSKTLAILRTMAVSMGVPAFLYAGVMGGFWPDPLSFLDAYVGPESAEGVGATYFLKGVILFGIIVVVYGGFVWSRQVQHISFLGEHVVVKRPLSQKRLPISDLQRYRFEAGKKRFKQAYLDFGYEKLAFKIEDYQQPKIETLIEQVERAATSGQAKAKPEFEAIDDGLDEKPPEVKVQRRPAASRSAVISVQSQVSAKRVFKAMQEQEESKSSTNAVTLLVISVVAFAGVGLYRWDVWFLVFIIAALFIHELGHLLAMRLFKYTNLKMLFLPFFGAMASGRPREQNAAKIALISIAGPVAGLLSAYVAVVAWFGSGNAWLLQFAWLSVLLNAFNLLPFKPLDGGHFLNETLLSRFPKAQLIFGGLAVAGLGFAAFKLETIVLGIVAFFGLVALPRSYGEAKVAKNLRGDGELREGELDCEKVERLMGRIAEIKSSLLFPAQEKTVAQIVTNIWGLTRKEHPKPLTSGLLLAGYLGLVLVVVPFSFGLVHGLRAGGG